MRHDQPIARLGKRERRLRGAARLATEKRLLGHAAQRMIGRDQIVERRADDGAGHQRAHCRIDEQQLACRVHDRDGVFEVLDGRLEVCHLSRHLRTILR